MMAVIKKVKTLKPNIISEWWPRTRSKNRCCVMDKQSKSDINWVQQLQQQQQTLKYGTVGS